MTTNTKTRFTIVMFSALILALSYGVSVVRKTFTQAAPGTLTRNIKVGDVTRSYLLHVPASYDGSKPIPLVLVFHGGESQPQQMERYSSLSEIADHERFIVAYPEGINKHWNDGRENAPKVNDVDFVLALLQELERTYKIDNKRIYATGISNGGMFSQRLGCELSANLAAIASVASSMPEALFTRCKVLRPISVLMIHGTDDPLIPYQGGAMPRATLGGSVLSVPATIDYWAKQDKCSQPPATTQLSDRDAQDGTRVRLASYRDCGDGVAVQLYTIEGGGHTLPGGRQYLPERLIGRTSKEINGSEVIWDFFKNHPAK